MRGGRALPRHVPKPLQPGLRLASVTDHRGRRAPLHTCVPADQWPPSSGMHRGMMLSFQDGWKWGVSTESYETLQLFEEQDERSSHRPLQDIP